MAKASISIGVNDATGQPSNGPRGPYITDEDDGSRPRRKRQADTASKRTNQQPAAARDHDPDHDLASRRKGPAQP
jgi:hypothetical protein